jgi:uncharacterized membrane protein
MKNLIEKYFLSPIRVEQGYNFVNTITYAVVALALLYAIFIILKRFKVKTDFKFFLATLPFILFGSTLRAFIDSGYMVRNFWTVSPGIYLLTTFIFLMGLVFGLLIGHKTKYPWYSVTNLIGIIVLVNLIAINITKINFENVGLFLGIAFTIVALAAAFYFVFTKLKWKWITDKIGYAAFTAHLLDATATAMILFFVGGWEKHPLPRFFIERFGAFSFIPLKMLVIIPAIYVMSTELKDKQLRNFLLIAIAVLGLAEGLRNLISLLII